jgi:hypothetical protein
MEFYNQSWFWAGFFTAVASLCGILIHELISTVSQKKLERLKLYESDVFKAYNNLYLFISRAYGFLWPPNEPQRDYISLMKNVYYKDVKANMLFFNSDIRELLRTLESQYN